MNKYVAIIDRTTLYVLALCLIVTYFCFQFDFRHNINVTLFSIAVIFPLVFTIREAFKRRDHALRFLSLFKASISAVNYCFQNNEKLSDEKKKALTDILHNISTLFFQELGSEQANPQVIRRKVDEVFLFVKANRDCISNGVALKIIRFLEDVHESIENTVGLKLHGTPVSLRAYCLVFIFVFPFVFIPSIVFSLEDNPAWMTYCLSMIHGFILISLYNVQKDMEDPFDQIGLDDIRLEEFGFQEPEPQTET
jgi:predicted membrane chloride channel (bestrophin family)